MSNIVNQVQSIVSKIDSNGGILSATEIIRSIMGEPNHVFNGSNRAAYIYNEVVFMVGLNGRDTPKAASDNHREALCLSRAGQLGITTEVPTYYNATVDFSVIVQGAITGKHFDKDTTSMADLQNVQSAIDKLKKHFYMSDVDVSTSYRNIRRNSIGGYSIIDLGSCIPIQNSTIFMCDEHNVPLATTNVSLVAAKSGDVETALAGKVGVGMYYYCPMCKKDSPKDFDKYNAENIVTAYSQYVFRGDKRPQIPGIHLGVPTSNTQDTRGGTRYTATEPQKTVTPDFTQKSSLYNTLVGLFNNNDSRVKAFDGNDDMVMIRGKKENDHFYAVKSEMHSRDMTVYVIRNGAFVELT